MDKDKLISEALNKINKTFGQGTITTFSEKPAPIEVIPTGSLGLDLALGVGGFPRGRIIEIYGGESSGKTTLTIHAMAEAQKTGGKVAFIDAEHAFDLSYAEQVGVNIKDLVLSQPDNGEQAFEICEALLQTKAFDIIVIDSVAALTPRAEIEGDFGDSKMGLHARMMSQAMRKLVAIIKTSNTTCIFINQTRTMIGVMYGSPITTTGGNALKFYASQRLEVSRTAAIKDNEGNAIASPVKVKVVKNKVAPPFRVCEFEILFGVGINKMGEIIDIGTELEIITKSGSWYSYEGTKIGQGRNSVVEFLNDNPEFAKEIEQKIKSLIK